MYTQADIDWCSAECARQKSGEMSVAHLAQAFWIVRDQIQHYEWVGPTSGLIVTLGKYVEPMQNRYGFRTLPIKIHGVVYPVDDFYGQVHILHNRYLDDTIERDEWYYRFEKLHPFNDGNGRVGSLIWNAMRDIEKLSVPPRFSDLEERFG